MVAAIFGKNTAVTNLQSVKTPVNLMCHIILFAEVLEWNEQ